MAYEAILFDMDGVIIDTQQSVTAFWHRLAAAHDIHLTETDFAQHIYGCAAHHTFDALFPHLTAEQRQAVMGEMERYEINLTYTEVKGVVAFLRALKAHGIPTALVTSGSNWKVDAVVGQLGLDGLFTIAVTANHIQHSKPDPECYLLAAQRLGKSPARCIIFEDAISGVKAAVASGALCVGVWPSSRASPLPQAGARYVVQDFSAVRLQTALGQKGHDSTALALWLDAVHNLPLIRG